MYQPFPDHLVFSFVLISIGLYILLLAIGFALHVIIHRKIENHEKNNQLVISNLVMQLNQINTAITNLNNLTDVTHPSIINRALRELASVYVILETSELTNKNTVLDNLTATIHSLQDSKLEK